MQSSLDASKADLQSVLENGGGVLEQEESGLQGSKAAGEGKLWFVAAHAWDLAGAKKGGYVPLASAFPPSRLCHDLYQLSHGILYTRGEDPPSRAIHLCLDGAGCEGLDAG
jgi:hypothetical protein